MTEHHSDPDDDIDSGDSEDRRPRVTPAPISSWRDNASAIFQFGVVLTLVIAVIIGVVSFSAEIIDTPNGPRHCRDEVGKSLPGLWESTVVIRTVWTRQFEGHPVAALVIRSKDLTDERLSTIICHFKTKDYAFDKYESFLGDRGEQLKQLSQSPFSKLNHYWHFGFKADSGMVKLP